MTRRFVVSRSNPTTGQIRTEESAELEPGQVRLRVDHFGLSSNNASYALFGDMLGYWAYFPVDDEHGCVPVWGFADVVESTTDDVSVGERLFGYLPMADELVVTPTSVGDRSLSDGSPHRAGLHPWYNRYHRCAADPVWSAEHEAVQATTWALFQTGWALAEQLAETVSTVVVSSASSKTALSLAWTLRSLGRDISVVGVTSAGNLPFVTGVDVYDQVTDYDVLAFDGLTGPVAFVDAAGSPGIKERVHAALGERLVDSVILGATHQGAGEATGDLVGPPPRFFFIPDVAEELAAGEGEDFHDRFAAAWSEFRPWIDRLLTIEQANGVDDIAAAYRALYEAPVRPAVAIMLSW